MNDRSASESFEASTTGYIIPDDSSSKSNRDKYDNINIAKAAYKHDQIVLDKNNEYNLKKFRLGLGYLGQIFGHEENSSKNITLIILVFLFGIVLFVTLKFYDYKNMSSFVENIWEKTFPVLTLSLGYIFGKK